MEKCWAAFTERNTFPSTLYLGITLVYVTCILQLKLLYYNIFFYFFKKKTIIYIIFFYLPNTSHTINLTFAELESSAMKSLSRNTVLYKTHIYIIYRWYYTFFNTKSLYIINKIFNFLIICATILSVLITASGLLG